MDVVGEESSLDHLQGLLDWCDIVHYHDVYTKQCIFEKLPVPKKPSVIQVHSPKSWFDYKSVLESKLPIAVIAQYHPREWVRELTYIVPNVVDIEEYRPVAKNNPRPVVSFAPSSTNGKDLNDKGYSTVRFYLKRRNDINFQLIHDRPFEECMQLKRHADIGIDDIRNGGYHLSALEYLSMGIATICYIDDQTERVVKDLTGCLELPFIHKGKNNIVSPMHTALRNYLGLGFLSRQWMETYWNPSVLCNHYTRMYESL